MSPGVPANFTHLHVHSHYTLLGGIASVEALARRAAADGLNYLALTDTNALYGAVAFAKACRAVAIQPILGMCVTVAPPPDDVPLAANGPGQMTLLAMGPEGYRSLCRLSSLLQGTPERDAWLNRGLSWDDLKAHRAGIICLESGRLGWLERYLRADNRQAASRYAARLGGIFQENCYLGLSLYQPEDEAIAREVAALGYRFGLPPVAVQPVYCLQAEEVATLRLLAAIDHNCLLDAVPSGALPAGGDPAVELHWLSPGDMSRRFASFADALTTVGEVAQRCGPALPDGRPIWPVLTLPGQQTAEEALAEQAQSGLIEK